MDAIITAIFVGVTSILAVGIPAWIALHKAWQEIAERKSAEAKLLRNGILEEWKTVTDLLNQRITTQNGRIDGLEKEISRMREQVITLYTENSELRSLLVTKDRRVEGQATQVEKLQTAVTLLKDAVPVLRVPDGSTVTIPELKQ